MVYFKFKSRNREHTESARLIKDVFLQVRHFVKKNGRLRGSYTYTVSYTLVFWGLFLWWGLVQHEAFAQFHPTWWILNGFIASVNEFRRLAYITDESYKEIRVPVKNEICTLLSGRTIIHDRPKFVKITQLCRKSYLQKCQRNRRHTIIRIQKFSNTNFLKILNFNILRF